MGLNLWCPASLTKTNNWMSGTEIIRNHTLNVSQTKNVSRSKTIAHQNS